MTRAFVTLSLFALIALAPACTDDCQRLADLSCQRLGEESEECARVREQADRAGSDDKRACAIALEIADDLTGER